MSTGFNLYYGALKGGRYRWLDLRAFAGRFLHTGLEVGHIHYFTARASDRPDDPDVSARQDAYLRAIACDPQLSIHYGRFLTGTARMMRVDRPGFELVYKTEEKGSDVNLATQLLLDAFDGASEGALVISNDSDLTRPVEVARDHFRLPVGLIMPVLNKNANGT